MDGYKEDGSGSPYEEVRTDTLTSDAFGSNGCLALLLQWASGTGVGTTLTLTWSSAVKISQIVLYDRPNLSDQITGSKITFGNGQWVEIGALVNDGSATYVNLSTPVTTSSLVFTVLSISSSTGSAGLAEIEVYAPGSSYVSKEGLASARSDTRFHSQYSDFFYYLICSHFNLHRRYLDRQPCTICFRRGFDRSIRARRCQRD